MNNKYYLLIILCVILCGCESKVYDASETLVVADSNSVHLNAVLSKYINEPEKLKAASYLISNMTYHSSIHLKESPIHDSLLKKIDSTYRHLTKQIPIDTLLKSPYWKNKRKSLALQFSPLPQAYDDIKICDAAIIDSTYLISNIDESFKHKSNDLKYDDFLELILPYRAVNEMFPLDKTKLRKLFSPILQDSVSRSNKVRLVSNYIDFIEKSRVLTHEIRSDYHAGFFDLISQKFKNDCQNIAAITCDIFRSLGVPIAYEFTPMWTDRPRKHYWCAILDDDGILKPFTPPDNNIMEDWNEEISYAGKVYRKTFGANIDTPYYINGDEYIPEVFSSPLLSDQTWRYRKTIDLRMDLPQSLETNLAYLCFFDKNDSGLSPVGWGKVSNDHKHIDFQQVPLNIVLFPAYYKGNVLCPLGDAFILCDNGISKSIPAPHTIPLINKIPSRHKVILSSDGLLSRTDISVKFFKAGHDSIKAKLLRKYQEKRNLKKSAWNLIGAVLVGYNTGDDREDTLLIIHDLPKPHLQDIEFKNQKRYNTYRLKTSNKKPINIAHIDFLGEEYVKGISFEPISLPEFGDEITVKVSIPLYAYHGIPLKTGSSPDKAFDGNMETYVGSSSVGMEFERPVNINRIRFAPRNANNGIVKGNTYSIYYYDRGWSFKETVIAEKNYIETTLPTGTLYWIVNETNGNEEFPFELIDGDQRFINQESHWRLTE